MDDSFEVKKLHGSHMMGFEVLYCYTQPWMAWPFTPSVENCPEESGRRAISVQV
jgi:hypothetical protein